MKQISKKMMISSIVDPLAGSLTVQYYQRPPSLKSEMLASGAGRFWPAFSDQYRYLVLKGLPLRISAHDR
jgi:hypothetical protein